MHFSHRKYDCLSGLATAAILDADVHEFFPLSTQGIPIRHLHLDVRATVVNRVRIEPLVYEGILVLLAQVYSTNASALESRLRLVESEIYQALLFHGLVK